MMMNGGCYPPYLAEIRVFRGLMLMNGGRIRASVD